MIVRELVTRLGFSVNDSNLKKYEGNIKNIKNSAESAANSFRNMFAAFVGFSAAQSLGKTAETMMSMEARVGMLPQTIGEASDAFDTVGKRASSARQSIDAYGNLYIKLQNAGKDFIKTQEEGLQVTDTLSKALVVGGATAQEQSSAMLQFAQAIGSGVLQGDEMRAMAEAAPQFMDELAKAIGVPRSEIKKMGSDGKLTSKVIIEAVKKMSSVFDEKFKQMPMTISQAITIGQNRWAMFINKLNRKSGTVTSIANFLLDGFDKIEKKLSEFIDWLGGASNAIKIFGIVLVAALGPAVISLIVGGFAAILTAGGALFAALLLLGIVVEDLYQFFTGGESVLGDFVEWLNSGTLAAASIKGILIALGIVLVTVAAGFVMAWLAALGPITLIVLGLMALYGAFLYFKDEVFAFMSDLWDSISSGFDSVVDNLNEALNNIIAGLASLYGYFVSFKDGISSFMNELWASITNGFYEMVDGLKSAWDNFKSFFTGGVNANVSASTVAGAATSAGGAGYMAMAQAGTKNITVNQTLPPGTAPETAAAAKGATIQALGADNSALARQMGQAQ